MTDATRSALAVLQMWYRRGHGQDAADDDALVIWAAEQLALFLSAVEREADAPAEPPAVDAQVGADHYAAQLAQINADAQR